MEFFDADHPEFVSKHPNPTCSHCGQEMPRTALVVDQTKIPEGDEFFVVESNLGIENQIKMDLETQAVTDSYFMDTVTDIGIWDPAPASRWTLDRTKASA